MTKTSKTASRGKTLILGAFPPEIKAIKAGYRGRKDIVVATTGIGLINAALNTAELLSSHRIDQVIFVGSVGAVNPKVKRLTLITAQSVTLKDVGEAAGISEQLPATGTLIRADRKWISRIAARGINAMKADVYSATGLTRSLAAAKKLSADLSNPAESLELYGVAAACKKFGVPWNSIQVVTNHIDSNARAHWKQNYLKAAAITSKTIATIID